MPSFTPASLTGRTCQRLMLAAATILLLSHLIHLSADPSVSLGPFGARNWSNDYYTDEGWATSGAVRAVLQNNWYIPGDFNLAVDAPMWSLLLYMPFKLFGVGIVVARATAAVLYMGTIGLAFLLLKRTESAFLASCVALLLACNFFAFNFSRLAMMESAWLFFLLLSLFVAQVSFEKKRMWLAVFAGFCLAIAILVKLTATFGGAPLLAILFLYRKGIKDFFVRALLSLAGALLLLLPYKFLFLSRFPADEAYYKWLNLSARSVVSIQALARHFVAVVYSAHIVDLGTYLCVLCGIVFCVFFFKRVRLSPLMLVAFTWLLANVAVCCTVSYTPPRYYLSFTVPMTILAVCFASQMWQYKRALGLFMVTVLVASLALNVGETVSFLARPNYEYQRLGDAVRQTAKTSGTDQNLIMSDYGSELSMYSGVPSLNEVMGLSSRAARITRHHPNIFLSNGPIEAAAASDFTQAGATIQPRGSYNLLHNYNGRQPMYLYSIQW